MLRSLNAKVKARTEIFVPCDIQLLFVVPPLSKGRNVEVVDNVCANSCELTAYIALCVSLSLFLSVFFFISSSLYSLFRSLRSRFFFLLLLRTLLRFDCFFQSFFCSPSRFYSRSDIFSPLSRWTSRTLQTLHGYIYIYVCVCVYIRMCE